MYHSGLKERMVQLEAEQAILIAEPATGPAPDVSLLVRPNVPALYRRKVAELEELLEGGQERDEARDLIRSMIDRIVLKPRTSGGLEAILYAELGAILAICAAAAGSPSMEAERASQLSVVGSEPFLVGTPAVTLRIRQQASCDGRRLQPSLQHR